MTTKKILSMGIAGAATLALASCSSGSDADPINVSGSATVYPITEAVARDLDVPVDQTSDGTLDGFEKFCNGESAINNASEAIPGAGQATDYIAMCADNDVDFIELPIALDALSLIRHEENGDVEDLSMEELRSIWEPGSTVTTWSDVRPEWPDENIELFGRGPGSATFDYFTYFATGDAGEIRDDYEVIDDPSELARRVADTPFALGFTGVGSYLAEADHREHITTIDIDGVQPNLENAQNGTYTPLTRPLFIYVSADALENDEHLEEFVSGYLDNVANVLPHVYYYPLSDYDLVKQRFNDRTTGTMFDGDSHSDLDVTEALSS